MAASQLEQRIAQFTQWREQLVANIDEFQSWQDRYGQADIEQTLRIYDLIQGLRNARVRLAFLGESAEYKIGLINALLFPDVPGGLLPAALGVDTVCAIEIFCDPNEAPCVRMLPIETRKRAETIAALRRTTIEWVTTRLDPESPTAIAAALTALAETREVSADEARALNLPLEGAVLRVPAWRYALINLPHPTLKSGLVAYYTPSPRLFAAEPEVAIRMTASAQGLLMVTGGELTPAAQAIWKQYAHASRARKLVVIDAGVDHAAAERIALALEAQPEQLFPVPLQAAIQARLEQRADDPAADNLRAIEKLCAEQLVPERQALLMSSVAKEIGPLVQSARQAVAARFIATVKEMQDLNAASGKNQSAAQDLLTRLEAERKTYQQSVASFNVTYANLMARGQELLATLHDDRIAEFLSHDREFIEGAWTTPGMWKSMQGLFAHFTEQVQKILNYATTLRDTVNGIYQSFHENFGLAKVDAPPLNLDKHLEGMQTLEANTSEFCHDPINIATYKDFLVKKFYDGLVEEARQQFEFTRIDADRWLRGALGPLNAQIMERQSLMLKRVENLRALKDNLSSVKERLRQLDQQRISIKKQGDLLDQLRTSLALVPAAKAGGETRASA
ncbi:MAG TPA: hypothetical protein VMT94_03770 [Burkholderiales bacterium]|nr:hypothetical protein [Burkholderiales bacterium]